ncbi:hypothetical protein Pla52o_41110 [Novipirellula galeiformis]|uniref:Uncharacterized protein n=1 Tax=Novipirellula galeiformis TaxID=2528004 RepID=A0A5C6CE42_9BACT|nr:hypothetical protein Pla52o_41110 [Novipirellula galeiformis]
MIPTWVNPFIGFGSHRPFGLATDLDFAALIVHARAWSIGAPAWDGKGPLGKKFFDLANAIIDEREGTPGGTRQLRMQLQA